MAVGPNDLSALQHIMMTPGTGPREIATLLGITTASSTALVDRLEAAGHLTKNPHHSDRRRLVLEATDAASAELGMHLAPLFQTMGKIAADLSPEEREAVVKFLSQASEAQAAFTRSLEEEK